MDALREGAEATSDAFLICAFEWVRLACGGELSSRCIASRSLSRGGVGAFTHSVRLRPI